MLLDGIVPYLISIPTLSIGWYCPDQREGEKKRGRGEEEEEDDDDEEDVIMYIRGVTQGGRGDGLNTLRKWCGSNELRWMLR